MSSVTDSGANEVAISTSKVSFPIITTPDTGVTNVDPLAGGSTNTSRTTQQQIQPSAISKRFLNPVQQSPQPLNVNSITLNDLGLTTQAISDGIVGPDTVALFIFSFTNTTNAPISVELCASLFIDGTEIGNAYPFGEFVASTEWSIERQKTAHFLDTSADPQTYLPNQSNQDTEFYIVKNLSASGNHQLFIYYYWRTIANQGGSKA